MKFHGILTKLQSEIDKAIKRRVGLIKYRNVTIPQYYKNGLKSYIYHMFVYT